MCRRQLGVPAGLLLPHAHGSPSAKTHTDEQRVQSDLHRETAGHNRHVITSPTIHGVLQQRPVALVSAAPATRRACSDGEPVEYAEASRRWSKAPVEEAARP